MGREATTAALWMLIAVAGCNVQQPPTEEALARAIYEAQGGDEEVTARADRLALRWRAEVGQPMLESSPLSEAQRAEAYKAFEDTMREALSELDDVAINGMVNGKSREELEHTLRYLKASSTQRADMTAPADFYNAEVEAFLKSASRRSMDAFHAKVETMVRAMIAETEEMIAEVEERAADGAGDQPTSP